MTTLAILLTAAAVALGLSRLLKLPSVPVLIIVGLVLREINLLEETTELHQILMLGLTFLVFLAGTELSFERIASQSRGSIFVGVVQFLALGGCGFFAALSLDYTLLTALYMALAVGASSTLVVVRLLQQRRQFFEPFGRFVLGILLIQDLLIILAIAGLDRFDDSYTSIFFGLGATLTLFALSWLLQRYLLPIILASSKLDEEILLVTTLALVFLFIQLTIFLDVHFIAGAFLGGIALSRFPVRGVIEAQFSSLSDFFVALFFVALGTSLTIPGIESLAVALALVFIVICLTPILIGLLGERVGLSTRRSLESGLLLAQTSEFSIIVALVGLEKGHLSQEVFGLIGLVTVFTMILTPFLARTGIAWFLTKLHPGRPKKVELLKMSDHLLMLGCGRTGLNFLKQIKNRDIKAVVIDEDSAVLAAASHYCSKVIRGDAADLRMLRVASARQARLVLSNLRSVEDNESICRFLKNQKVYVRVFEKHDAERISLAGGKPLLYSLVAADHFMEWYDNDFNPQQG